MAELKVEKKSNFPWWIWLIVAVVIIVLLIFFLGNTDENDNRSNYDRNDTTEFSEVFQTVPDRVGLNLYGSAVTFQKATMRNVAALENEDLLPS